MTAATHREVRNDWFRMPRSTDFSWSSAAPELGHMNMICPSGVRCDLAKIVIWVFIYWVATKKIDPRQ